MIAKVQDIQTGLPQSEDQQQQVVVLRRILALGIESKGSGTSADLATIAPPDYRMLRFSLPVPSRC